MTCPDQPDRQPIQRHRLVLLAAGVFVREEKVLLVSGLPVKKVMILHGSRCWTRGRRWCCPLALWLQLGAFGAFSLSLTGLGGIGTCLSASGLSRFASLLLQQPKFHE